MECKVIEEIPEELDYSGFNRNIVECKDFKKSGLNTVEYSFNRNIVECKVLSPHWSAGVFPVLIETLWNVK